MDVVTLGSFILDDIYDYPPVKQPAYNVVGGAGIYAAVGARMLQTRPSDTSITNPSPGNIGLLIHRGADFPEETTTWINGLDVRAKFVERADSLTTRGQNVYDSNGNRSFAFLHPNVRIEAEMLDDDFLMSKTFHMICTPARCIRLCTQILASRRRVRDRKSTGMVCPFFVWEPMEDSCDYTELAAFQEAVKYVDVFSPNEREILALCGMNRPDPSKFSVAAVSRAARLLLTGSEEAKVKAIIVRCGPHGCVTVEGEHITEIPAYHDLRWEAIASEYVRDATGGGNTFLGGLCAAIACDFQHPGLSKLAAATIYGNVAASYAIEQVGPPELTRSPDGNELWNGTSSHERVKELVKRLEQSS